MRIGCDVDGVLADFNSAYIDLIIESSGRDLFPPRPFNIPTWYFPEHYGYTQPELNAVWTVINASDRFWRRLAEYPDYPVEAINSFQYSHRPAHDLYFITARPGATAKRQTEDWLLNCGIVGTVLISANKAGCAEVLELDHYLDDRWRNAVKVSTTATRSYLMDRSWNRKYDAAAEGVTRVGSVGEFLGLIVGAG